MDNTDYYKALGIERSATPDEIKSAFRKAARKYHPDINKEPGAEAKFKEINDANEVLSDPKTRASYDRYGANWKEAEAFEEAKRRNPNAGFGADFAGAGARSARGSAGFGGAGFGGGGFGGSGFGAGGDDASDMFEEMFGRASRQRAGAGARGGGRRAKAEARDFDIRGEDHHARIVIDLRDTFEGAKRELSLRIPEVDADGQVRVVDRTLHVQIPKGILAGQHIRLKGQGMPGFGKGEAGDLYLEVEFKPDPLYRVDGRNLYIDLPLAPWEAALGASVRTPTPAGAIMLKVPPGSQPGRELRVKGRGIPAKEPGDLYAVLKVVLPPAESAASKAAYEALRDANTAFDPRNGLGE